MEVVCRYLWTWNLSAYHFIQLGIQLISMTIHFHESCQSFESFKRMHCPLLYCVSVLSSHAAKSFCHAAWCSRGIWRSFTSAFYIVFVLVSLIQSYGYYIHIIPELCYEFCVVEGGPWWVPNRHHETQNTVLEWCECSNHMTDSKILTQRLCRLQR